MKRLIPLVLLAIGLPLYAGGSFVGVEIVPHTFEGATYGIPYFTFGWDADWAVVSAGSSAPLTLDSWYEVSVAAAFQASSNWRFTPGLSVWGNLSNFVLEDGRWAFFLGGSWNLENQFSVYFRLHIPYQVRPSDAFLGVWATVGFDFYPFGGVQEGL